MSRQFSTARRYGSVFNVKAYGATGDGTTDDTAAINAAYAAASSEGDIIYLPPNNVYGISSTINIAKHVTLRGGESGTINAGAEIKALSAVDPMFNVTADDVGVQNLYLRGTGTGTGLYYNGTGGGLSGCRISNLVVASFPIGLLLDNTIASIIENVRSNPGQIRLRNGCTSISLIGCYAQNLVAGSGYLFDDVRYISVSGCASDSNSNYGYETTSTCESIAFVGCGAESCGFGWGDISGETISIISGMGVSNGPDLDGTNEAASGVQANGKHISIIGFNDRTPSDAGTRIANIHATASAEDVTVIGGVLDMGVKDQGTRTFRLGVDDVDTGDADSLVYTGPLKGTDGTFSGAVEMDGALNHDGSTVGFYGTAPVAQQTGVGVDAASIHAALVSLGLITA